MIFFSPTTAAAGWIETWSGAAAWICGRPALQWFPRFSFLVTNWLFLVATKVSGDGNKIHTANCNSGESNVSSLRIGKATKWKKTSTNDIASKPLVKMDYFQGLYEYEGRQQQRSNGRLEPSRRGGLFSFQQKNRHASLFGNTQGRKVERSCLLVEADVSLDTTGV